MTIGDVDVRIVNADTTLVDAAVTAQLALHAGGLSGSYMCCSIGPENQQVMLIAMQTKA